MVIDGRISREHDIFTQRFSVTSRFLFYAAAPLMMMVTMARARAAL